MAAGRLDSTVTGSGAVPKAEKAIAGPEPSGGDAPAGGEEAGDEPIEPGTAVGRFVVRGRLGAGAMGVVYAADDCELDRRVALKFLRDPGQRRAQRRLQREAQALARLSHPNVIGVHDIGSFHGDLFLALEHTGGRTLRDWMAESPRDWREIAEVFRRAGDGLAAAHAVGIIHRDFKPDNVLIDDAGQVRVGDFGLAMIGSETGVDAGPPSAGDGPAPAALTATGVVLGTPAYMAPEQLAGRGPIDARADQFSFCVAFHEGLHGRRPFDGDSVGELTRSIQAGAIAPAPVDRGVPAWLDRVVRRGLAFDPAARHPSMAALLAELAHDRGRRRRRVVAVAVAAALIGGGVAAGAIVGRPADAGAVCEGAADRLAGVWDPARKRALHDAFRATGSPDAEVQFAAMERRLDDFAVGWAAMHADSCEATHVRGEQSLDLLDRRTACLDRRLMETGALVDEFLRVDSETVERATAASRQIGGLASCADRTALLEEVQPLDRAGRAARAAKLGAARATLEAGRWAEALPRLREVVDEARRSNDRAIEAAALVDVARAEREAHPSSGRSDAAADTIYRALAAADAAGARETAVQAWIQIMILETDAERYEDALRGAQVARAALDQIAVPPALEVDLASQTADALIRLGRFDEARAQLETVLARVRRHQPPDRLLVAELLTAIGGAELGLKRRERALELYRQAEKDLEATLGPLHPSTIDLVNNQAAVLIELDRLDEAETTLLRGLAQVARANGTASQQAALLHYNLGSLYDGRERPRDALAQFEAARAIHEARYGPRDRETAYLRLLVAAELSSLGRSAEALAMSDEAARTFLAAETGDPAARADTLQILGEIRRECGRPAEAIEPLEQAAALRADLDGQPIDRALGTFALAQALLASGRDRRRAIALAEEALAALVAADSQPDIADVKAWLAAARRRR
jgi:tetratricopeptide (TPR) repeat protein